MRLLSEKVVAGGATVEGAGSKQSGRGTQCVDSGVALK